MTILDSYFLRLDQLQGILCQLSLDDPLYSLVLNDIKTLEDKISDQLLDQQ